MDFWRTIKQQEIDLIEESATDKSPLLNINGNPVK